MTPSPLSPQHAEPTEADWATIVDITGAGHAPQVTELLLVQALADERATVRRQKAVIDAVTELHKPVEYHGKLWCSYCGDPGYGGQLHPCPTVQALASPAPTEATT